MSWRVGGCASGWEEGEAHTAFLTPRPLTPSTAPVVPQATPPDHCPTHPTPPAHPPTHTWLDPHGANLHRGDHAPGPLGGDERLPRPQQLQHRGRRVRLRGSGGGSRGRGGHGGRRLCARCSAGGTPSGGRGRRPQASQGQLQRRRGRAAPPPDRAHAAARARRLPPARGQACGKVGGWPHPSTTPAGAAGAAGAAGNEARSGEHAPNPRRNPTGRRTGRPPRRCAWPRRCRGWRGPSRGKGRRGGCRAGWGWP
jgi:hypothetical protein